MWWLRLAYFNPALLLYENHRIDLLHKSVNRFLCNGKTDKVYLQINIFVVINNSIFHSSLSCLEKNYDLRHKTAKKQLSIILKLSMISVQCFPQRAVFYRFYNVICRNCKSVLLLKRCYLLEKKKLQRFIKPKLLNFQNCQPSQLLSSCFGLDLKLSLSCQQLDCNMYFWSFLGKNGA